jgi:hypothetical protein
MNPGHIGPARVIHHHLFSFAPEGANVVVGGAPDIPVTPGNYSSLELIDFAVSGTQANQEYVLVYEDGSTSSSIRAVSDWLAPAPQADERIAFNLPLGSPSGVGQFGNFHAFHRSLPVDPAKVLVGFRLPPSPNVNLLSATLVGAQ